MKKILFPLMVLIAFMLLEGCTSGKKAYQKGNYDEAVLKAISRLRKSPNSKKASQTLMESYPLTISWHQDNVERAKQSNDDFKWERVVREYNQVNNLYSQLNRCPACLRLVNNPVHYVVELNDAKERAAAIRYQRGDELLTRARSNHNRNEAIEAYRHFEVACNLMGEYRDARDKLAEAKFLATLKVVVEPIPAHRSLQISHEFFENKILEFVETMQVNEFVQFYSFTEAKNIGLEEPDQIIQLQFDDFVLGQVYLKEKEIQVSKDSVVLAVIKAQNIVIGSDVLAANILGESPGRALKYFQATPIFASPVLKSDSYYYQGGNNKMVTICHKIPASLGKSQTITVSQNALAHHLDHGDIQGTCNGEKDPQSQQKESTKSQTSSNSPTSSNNSGTVNTSTSQSSGTSSQNATSTTITQNSSGSSSNSQTSGSVNSQGASGYTGSNLGTIQNNTGNTVITTYSNSTVEPKPTTRKVYGTVKATVHVFNKTLSSRGILDFKIIDAHNQRVLTQEKMPGEFVWYTEWGYFNGDERALDDYFLEIVKLKEASPPPPQDLFVAFTQPIFSQITGKIRDFYRNY